MSPVSGTVVGESCGPGKVYVLGPETRKIRVERDMQEVRSPGSYPCSADSVVIGGNDRRLSIIT